MYRTKVLAAAIALTALSVSTVEAQEMRYTCTAGETDYEIVRAVGTGTLIDPQFVIVATTMGEMKNPLDDAFVLPMARQGVYEGPEGSFSLYDLTFTPIGEGPIDCGGNAPDGAVTASIPAGDAGFGPGSVAQGSSRSQRVDLAVPGRSLGGRARGAPSTDGAIIGSLAEGTPVTIVADTGVWMNGYNWFEIEVNGRAYGYQWGGILCAPGGGVRGTFPCP